jgi:glycosyltransferase involved in cell wall biosynthesis
VSADRLRIGVPAALLELAPVGGHGKVWHRVLAELGRSQRLIALPARGWWRVRRPDVVLASGHDDLPDTRGAPLVVQVHEAGWFAPELRDTLDPAFLAHIAPRTERAVQLADAVIVPSHAGAGDLVAAYGLSADRVHAVHHGVDPGFAPGVTGGSELVGTGVPYVLYAATLHPRKNLSAVLAAVARLAGEGFPHVLAVAGHPAPDRADSSALEAALAGEGVVRIGRTSDLQLAALMAGAAAVCLPSLYEGFGLTALEALACGAPLVVSDRGALPEVVGDAAVVVAPTVDAVAGGLRDVLTEPALSARLRAAGPQRARRFTWEQTAVGWLAVLRGAAGAA